MNHLLLEPRAQIQPHLMQTQAMQQAFLILQMPIQELEEWVKNAIDENPALEITEFSSPALEERPEYFGPHQVSLFEHLMTQARLSFPGVELGLAEEIIGNLDEKGFFSGPLEDENAKSVLAKIQTFDPPGIAAMSLKESLLLQLRLEEKESTLAYTILTEHFENFLQGQHDALQKKLGCSRHAFGKALKEISALDPQPAARFRSEPTIPLAPDLLLAKEGKTWIVDATSGAIPRFQIAPLFLEMHEIFRKEIAQGKWLEKALGRRKKTLHDIGVFLTKKQSTFLTGERDLPAPCTMLELAHTLNLHPSTVHRATMHKYVACERGLLPLRSFFSQEVLPDYSQARIKALLKDMVEKEDARLPLSDQKLAQHFERLGLPLARRTIAKYRTSLHIPPASRRRIVI